jgi:YesN/AraC family two-component response regulator
MPYHRKYRVLIVEDERWSLELMSEWVSMRDELELGAYGTNGLEALDIVRETHSSGSPGFDLILLDISMPGMSGLEFLEELGDIPFVIFTTAHEEYAVKAFEIGAVDYLMKPIEHGRFNKAIDRFLTIIENNIPYDIYPVIEELKGNERYKKSNLTEETAEIYSRKIINYMREKRAFTDEDITLTKMARDLSIPPYHLSQVLNTKLKMNFYNMINSYRVDEAMKLLTSPQCRDVKILEISKMAGFKSKSVFNSVFKEFTNLTPKEYRDKIVGH